MKYKSLTGIIAVLIIFFAVFYSYYSLIPHSISGENTPLEKFSTSRAMKHIKNMTKQYHFVGTPYHESVKNYIIDQLNKMGLEVKVQTQSSLNDKWRGITTNDNIYARIKGKNKGKSLLLLSHYDSAPFASKGASDDGVGVAAVLEVVRTLLTKKNKPLHDIIILFTDGEEIGLNGAKAFCEHHPWVNDVALVINFEARGSGGPSYTLMETNGGNANMVKYFAKSNPHYPVANSLLYSVYKMLPNDTDLTMFREIKDIEGYNFAFIDDFYDYHCATDNYKNVDINTVEQQGDYMMSLTDYFYDKDIDGIKAEEDYVFFNFPVAGIIYYPFSWAVPLYIILVILFLISTITGISKNKYTLKNLFKSFIPLLGSLISSILLAIFGWKLILKIHPGFNDILHGFPYNGHFYIAAFALLSLWLSFVFYRRYIRKMRLGELLFAPMILWLILTGIFTFMLRGASFMIIPVYFLLAVIIIDSFFDLNKSSKIIIYTLLAIPGLIILSPFIDMFPVGLRMPALPVSMIFTILIFAILLPVLKNIYFRRELSILTLIFTLLIFAMAEANAGFDKDHPKPNSINYVYYADENKAYWETYTQQIDNWLANIMGDKIKKGSHSNTDIMNKFHTNITYHSPAPLIDLALPEITKVQDTITGDIRQVSFEIKSMRNANRIDLVTKNDIDFQKLEINGNLYRKDYMHFSPSNALIFSYYLTKKDETINVKMTFDKNIKASLLIYESSYDLYKNKELSLEKRPEGFTPMPFILNDLIITVKKLDL